jgi:8-oxo-dGTP pyrophosphatase MutT (NUDIX family)
MKFNLIKEAKEETNITIELPQTDATEAIEYIIKNFGNIVSFKNTQVFDYGIEGYYNEPNGKPIRKITFYIKEKI